MLTPTYPNVVKVGLIMTDPYDIFHPTKEDEDYIEYWGYDILFGDQLITLIPEDFIDRVVLEDEESNEKLEEIPD